MAQDNRLDIFRLLVQAGPDGLAAGRAAEELDLAPNKLTFHFDRLRAAGLVTVHREGRSMIYTARLETMNSLVEFLTQNCCQGAPCDGSGKRVARIAHEKSCYAAAPKMAESIAACACW
jgi:ArsR family transcriptional regulator